ncbi:MAG TPA: NUDIX domain-containing protein [Propionibacteriaceae bacterium]|nr:NUDIX domain-containing protein [Propionibacteriaceae bacterium]
MPTPAYIENIRRSYGSGLLLLPGVTAVVLRPDEGGDERQLLLVRRADSGHWTLPAGIVEPNEQPADTLVREVLEETCVHIRPRSLAQLTMDEAITYPNGDHCQFLAMTFRCDYLAGDAQVGDEESTEVRWCALSELPGLSARDLRRIASALSPDARTVFDAGIV